MQGWSLSPRRVHLGQARSQSPRAPLQTCPHSYISSVCLFSLSLKDAVVAAGCNGSGQEDLGEQMSELGSPLVPSLRPASCTPLVLRPNIHFHFSPRVVHGASPTAGTPRHIYWIPLIKDAPPPLSLTPLFYIPLVHITPWHSIYHKTRAAGK